MKKFFISFILMLTFIIPNISYAQTTSEPIGERIVKEAALWLGSPYGSSDGGNGYGSQVDCSGLVMQVFKKFGVELPRPSYEQAKEGTKIPLNEMIAGDIVCFVYDDGDIGHVGIYIGGNAMIHSPRPEKFVEISKNFEDWGSIKAAFGRRIEFESDYTPESLDENTEKEIKKLLSEKNTLSIDHLKDIEFDEPDQDEENDNDAHDNISDNLIKTIVLEINNPLMIVDGEQKPIEGGETTITPRIINNRTHLPLRRVAEEFGAVVEWVGGEKNEIKVTCGDTEITLWIDSLETVVNGQTKYIDSVPVIMQGRTFLPIRFIANELGWNLEWDGENQKISLSATISEI